MSYQIRTIDLTKDSTPIDWAAQEGWNPGLYDAKAFYAADNQGFYVGFLDDRPISCISAVAYDDSFGFIGLYIVKPEYRGQGYGLKIWKTCLKHLPTQNIGLDGVVAQQDNYKKSGFKLAYRNIRYQGTGLKTSQSRSKHITEVATVPFAKLLAYDSQLFPTARPEFLQEWISQPESLTLVYSSSDSVEGYGMVRKCQQGYKVGPLFADNKQIAAELLEELRKFVGQDGVIFFDTPEPNKSAIQLAESCGMKPMFETARMYTKKVPDVPLERIFGVTTFELG